MCIRIEAEKRRHDDRRGYIRPEDPRSFSRQYNDSYAQGVRNRDRERGLHSQRDDHSREQSILSRTARSNTGYARSRTPSFQYRVVEKNRHSYVASTPHQSKGEAGVDLRSLLPALPEKSTPQNSRAETTPTRTIKDRLGVSSLTKGGSNSGSKERRSALERLTGPNAVNDPQMRISPNFESGRLQEAESRVEEELEDVLDREQIEEPILEVERIPASQRLGSVGSGSKSRRGVIPD
ncbi:unnamed protein product [Eruca vesicaria subsp. sativa]|uniref:Uncharacterized protein n=1 Tax=Eruca vesicaria subsp. sativa TaxID=29727 RepID=A0ABC8LVV3_ERUVS|nr:unnamed protein product [Eruca vesicaria subsp. sativa]